MPHSLHSFLLAALCLPLATLCAATDSRSEAKTAEGNPHIVMFVADDHGYFDSGPYGDKVVRTPNIDRMAAQSMRFTRAFAASPLCVPSRCAYQTGMDPFRNGGHAFGTGIKEDVKTMPEYMKELGYRCLHAGKTHWGNGRKPPFEKAGGDWSNAIKFIEEHDKNQPLFLVVCTRPPHLPWVKNDGYDPAKVKLPPNFVDDPVTREWRTRYYSDVTLMDSMLGGVLEALRDNGYDDNTLVVYTSDQGANWPFAKWCVYDEGLRVPMLVRWPGKVKPGGVTDAMVGLIDLLPTFVEAAGGKAPADIDGRSFLKVLEGGTDTHRDVIYGSHSGYLDGIPGITNHSPARTIRTGTHRYILNLDAGRVFDTHITGCKPKSRWYVGFWDAWVEKAKTDPAAKAICDAYRHRPMEELFEVEKDPYNMRNVAENPGNAELLEKFRKQLAAWRRQQGDDVPLVKPGD